MKHWFSDGKNDEFLRTIRLPSFYGPYTSYPVFLERLWKFDIYHECRLLQLALLTLSPAVPPQKSNIETQSAKPHQCLFLNLY
jgi:hypothetical protein